MSCQPMRLVGTGRSDVPRWTAVGTRPLGVKTEPFRIPLLSSPKEFLHSPFLLERVVLSVLFAILRIPSREIRQE